MASEAKENWEALCERVSKRLEKERVPGAALGVVQGDRTFTAGFGITNVNHPLEVTDETHFQAGSISKTFASTALLRLVESGVVDLGATVRT